MRRSPYLEASALARAGQIKVRWHDWLSENPEPIGSGIPVHDKVEGMMLGLAIGDSLGNTSESINPQQRQARHGWIRQYLPNRHAAGETIGLPSDDTQLAFRTLEHLVENGHLDPQLLGNRLASGRIFGLGKAVREWLDCFGAGVSWDQSGTLSAGNGALMRIAPLVIPRLRDPNCDLWAETLMAAHLTHDDELSNVSCVALVDGLWRAIGTRAPVPRGWWLQRWLEVCDALGTGQAYPARNDHPPGFNGTISQMLREHVEPALQKQLPVDRAGEVWHSGAYLLETVPTLVYILERFGNDPQEAILQAVNCTRDNDTIAAVVGAAVGALHGASALPKAWVESLSGRMATDDDHCIFHLLACAGEKFGYGASPMVAERAQRYVAAHAGKAEARVSIPGGLLGHEVWFKVVSFLQQNWAVIRPVGDGKSARIWFVDDGFGVFDFIDCDSAASAARALQLNGFRRFDREIDDWVESEIPAALNGLHVPKLSWRPRRIYSSRQYWVDPFRPPSR